MLGSVILLLVLCVVTNGRAAEADREADFLTKLNTALKASLTEKLTEGFKARGFRKAGNSLRKLSVTAFSNAYATTGFVYQNLYVGTTPQGDASCASPTSVYGEAVNRCHRHEHFSYKYQLTTDGCKGAIIEYFSDQNCKYLLGTNDLEPHSQLCGLASVGSLFESYGVPVYQSLRCTTSNVPVVPTQPFTEKACGGLENSFNSVVADTCSYSSSIGFYTESDCASSFSLGFSYDATTCSEERQVFSAICFRNIAYDASTLQDDEVFIMSQHDDSALDLLNAYRTPVLPAGTQPAQDDKVDITTEVALAREQEEFEKEDQVLYRLGYCPASDLHMQPVVTHKSDGWDAAAMEAYEKGEREAQAGQHVHSGEPAHQDHQDQHQETERRLAETASVSSWLISHARRKSLISTTTLTPATTGTGTETRAASSPAAAGWTRSSMRMALRGLLEEMGDVAAVPAVDPLTVACLVGMLAGAGFCATLWAVYSIVQAESSAKSALLLV